MNSKIEDRIFYEDNHIIVVEKLPSEIVQGDKSGDRSMMDDIKEYLKQKYNKKGNVYLGLIQRLDRPVGGVIIYAKTSKAASRMSEMIKKDKIHKTYLAVTYNKPSILEDTLSQYMYKNEKQNKSYIVDDIEDGNLHDSIKKNAKKAVLNYRYIKSSDRYHLIEIDLITGRHHQIRCQLASINCIIKGDLKYGAPRSNKDKSISLWSYKVTFVHPVRKEPMTFISNPRFGIKVFDNYKG